MVGATLAACGASAPDPNSRSAGAAHGSIDTGGLRYARCMRSHGISHFPDPSADGRITLRVSGMNPASPAFRAAASACQRLLPAKQPSAQPPSPRAYTRLLAWSKCMRRHGVSGLPDPRPDPVPGPGAAATRGIATIMGDGGYWVGIPSEDRAHSSTFMRLSTRCGESPSGPVGRRHRA